MSIFIFFDSKICNLNIDNTMNLRQELFECIYKLIK